MRLKHDDMDLADAQILSEGHESEPNMEHISRSLRSMKYYVTNALNARVTPEQTKHYKKMYMKRYSKKCAEVRHQLDEIMDGLKRIKKGDLTQAEIENIRRHIKETREMVRHSMDIERAYYFLFGLW